MPEAFQYDVFLSHSSKDKPIVRELANRLKTDGLKVWFDEWEIKPGDSIPAKIDQGLEQSRVLVFCMSANAFGSDWARLESQTFRFRDPLNKARRFIPVRLDDAPIKGSLGQFLYVSWLPPDREQQYGKLRETCRPFTRSQAPALQDDWKQSKYHLCPPQHSGSFLEIVLSGDGRHALTLAFDHVVRVWDIRSGRCERSLEGHTGYPIAVAWNHDGRQVLSGAGDRTVRVWEVETGRCRRVLKGHDAPPLSLAWGHDGRRAASGAEDNTIRVWDIETGRCDQVLEGHSASVLSLVWSRDARHIISGGADSTMRVWDLETGRCERVLEERTGAVHDVDLSSDGQRAISAGNGTTIRVWDLETGRCERVIEGHTGIVQCVAWNPDHPRVLSGSNDGTVRLWDMETGRCLRVLAGHEYAVRNVTWGADQYHAVSADEGGDIHCWDLSVPITTRRDVTVNAPVLDIKAELHDSISVTDKVLVQVASDQVQYTNAKVLLVGESGVGKTGLSKVLAGEEWQPSDSTVGAWATQWKLPVSSEDGSEREIWLWDFGGQADQRLIHQLYMDETALAVLVFDGQKEDLFETLAQWDRDLTRASRRPFKKLLTAARVDAGGLRISRDQIKAFAKERGYCQFLETSAKKNVGCEQLREAIIDSIQWENIPWRSSPMLFKRLKEEIVRLKDEGRVLMRFNELRETLRMRLSGEDAQFADEELKAVVTLLAGPCVVWELKFGSWVLLQPARINAYAQAVIQTMRADEFERGCIAEERVLGGNLVYHSSMDRIDADEERFVLLAMHQTLVERSLCLRERTDHGVILIFPSYHRRERPELLGHPAVLVSYRFGGFLDEIYATLVVRLHHMESFQRDHLWRYAADFKTLAGKQLGVKLNRRSEGTGELEVYFDPGIESGEKIIFSKYVHEHLLRYADDVERFRHYVCPYCGTPVGSRDVAKKRLEGWLKNTAQSTISGQWSSIQGQGDLPTIICQECEKRVPLWDDLEQHFADPETHQRVRKLQEHTTVVLDNESKERALVGEVISTVALAGQISREFSVSDHGIDMEIEFKDDNGSATGQKLYLQLKSGDSYLRERTSDGADLFRISNLRHAHYWMAQQFPVLLVIRNSQGSIRWMEIRDWLRRARRDGKRRVRHIVFKGERFDVMSVRCWRDWALSQPSVLDQNEP